MNAFDLMSGPIQVVSRQDSIAHVRNMFLKHKVSKLLVVDEESKPVGLITNKDLADAFLKARKPVDEIFVESLMHSKVIEISAGESPEVIAKIFIEEKVSAVIVQDDKNDTLLGIITKTDLLPYFVDKYHGRFKVADLMHPGVVTVRPNHSIFHAIKVMEEENIGQLIVHDSEIRGLVSAAGVANATYGLRPKRVKRQSERTEKSAGLRIVPLTVGDVMQSNISTIPSKSDAASAARLMLDKSIGSVVVKDKGKLTGIITKADLCKVLAETHE